MIPKIKGSSSIFSNISAAERVEKRFSVTDHTCTLHNRREWSLKMEFERKGPISVLQAFPHANWWSPGHWAECSEMAVDRFLVCLSQGCYTVPSKRCSLVQSFKGRRRKLWKGMDRARQTFLSWHKKTTTMVRLGACEEKQVPEFFCWKPLLLGKPMRHPHLHTL